MNVFRIAITVAAVSGIVGCGRTPPPPGKHSHDAQPDATEAGPKTSLTQSDEWNRGDPSLQPDPERISNYVRRIFEDGQGHLWFGTNGDGVCRYDGSRLEYFSAKDGFGGFAVRGIVQDAAGHVWFGTNSGLTRYDGESFRNYTTDDGLIHDDVWSLTVDRRGVIWIGTLQGVSRFDGRTFTEFELPATPPDPTRGVTSSRIVQCIMQDSQDRMWFATNGGAFVLEGSSLQNISTDDGLCHNSVNCILEATDGTLWFATHHNGVCRREGTSFTHFGAEHGIEGTEAWDLYEDSAGNIWFPIEHSGVYRFDGESFTQFHRAEGLASEGVQCTFEDSRGRVWFGGVFGLFRQDGTIVRAIGRSGPWD